VDGNKYLDVPCGVELGNQGIRDAFESYTELAVQYVSVAGKRYEHYRIYCQMKAE